MHKRARGPLREDTDIHAPVLRREGDAALAAAEPLGSHRPARETLEGGRVDRERFENGGSHARRLRHRVRDHDPECDAVAWHEISRSFWTAADSSKHRVGTTVFGT